MGRHKPKNGLSTHLSSHRVSSSTNTNSKRNTSSIPRLPRIKRHTLADEIKLASQQSSNTGTHNIASIVNCQQRERSSNFLTEFIWEDDTVIAIDTSPPYQLQSAAKRKITPNHRKRSSISTSKRIKFESIKQLNSHRSHLAELFANDDETKQ